MSSLIVLKSSHAATAIAEFGEALGWWPDQLADYDQATRLVRFRRYATVLCDASFEGPFCTAGLQIARAAKRADRRTRTIVLVTWMSPEIRDAYACGDVDVVLRKPLPLWWLFEHVLPGQLDTTSHER